MTATVHMFRRFPISQLVPLLFFLNGVISLQKEPKKKREFVTMYSQQCLFFMWTFHIAWKSFIEATFMVNALVLFCYIQAENHWLEKPDLCNVDKSQFFNQTGKAALENNSKVQNVIHSPRGKNIWYFLHSRCSCKILATLFRLRPQKGRIIQKKHEPFPRHPVP